MTGIVLAVGQITFMSGVLIMPIVVAHPCPVSPSPCRKISVDVCFAADWIITGAAAIVSGFSDRWKLAAFSRMPRVVNFNHDVRLSL